ncbi:MAG: single-stranded-DNA-specific exonuclease RecJ [Candidatus Microsaccharimonas sp.]
MNLFERILEARGLSGERKAVFLSPNYNVKHDPFLLPDMHAAVDRLVEAHARQEKITIYGDYDIDGLTATTVLLDSLKSFGFKHVSAFIPNRFVEGYGLTVDAVDKIITDGAELILTVDCGSLSHQEISRAKERGVDVIVTDHHNVAEVQPEAVAVINPKRLLMEYADEYDQYVLKPESKHAIYPFLDLAGVGVAFKLVQALQTKLKGLENGQEKWLLDLVALGTVCDIVTLRDENRTNVYYGLKVLAQTRRPGLKALMMVSGVRPETINARSLGFGLGPRMNASGRLETAKHTLDLLIATDPMEALQLARHLDEMNQERRRDQDEIFKQALVQAEEYANDSVLVVSAEGWNHGIVGIVAAKLLERYQKPTYVLAIHGDEAKGSARSYGDFSAADAIRASDDIITKGGGHKLAAGVILPTTNIAAFRKRVNKFYASTIVKDQVSLLLPKADTDAELEELDESLLTQLATLEPYGSGNPQPIVRLNNVIVMNIRRMGDTNQHVKLTVQNNTGHKIDALAFNAPQHFFVEPGTRLDIWCSVELNEWNGNRSVEGKLLHLVEVQ